MKTPIVTTREDMYATILESTMFARIEVLRQMRDFIDANINKMEQDLLTMVKNHDELNIKQTIPIRESEEYREALQNEQATA